MRLSNLTLAAVFSLAIAFIFSCSGSDGKDGADCIAQPKDNANDGFDIFCEGEKIGEILNGKAECIFEPRTNGRVDVICNDEKVGELINGVDGLDGIDGIDGNDGINCGVEEDGAYYTMICGEEEKSRWPKATCGTNAYDPAEKECNGTILSFTFVDSRDSNKYKAVVIGTQTWMAENLNYKVGDSRCYGEGGNAYVNSSGSSTYYDTLSASAIQSYCAKYGRLYDWSTAMALPDECNNSFCSAQISSKQNGICPEGWHVPNDTEWNLLIEFVGGSSVAGTKLKAKSDWDNYVSYKYYGGKDYESLESGNGTDDYGFAALPGGYYNYYFTNISQYGRWWSATGTNSEGYANGRYTYNNYTSMYSGSDHKSYNYHSVRCIMD